VLSAFATEELLKWAKGNLNTMAGINPDLIVGAGAEVIAGENMTLTATVVCNMYSYLTALG
jgi:urease alpha subunit